VVYSEGAVVDLLETLSQLSGPNTTILLAGELRNGMDWSFIFLHFWAPNPIIVVNNYVF
jgi:hypothetical protein